MISVSLLGVWLLSGCGTGLCPLGGCDQVVPPPAPIPTNLFTRFGAVGGTVSAMDFDSQNRRLYLGGSFRTYRMLSAGGLVRVYSNGAVDTHFDPTKGFNSTVFALTLARDGTGDVFVGGSFSDYGGDSVRGFVRLNSNGSIDSDFDIGNGVNGSTSVFSIEVTNDGSNDIYLGGSFTEIDSNNSSKIARVNSDGSFDSGFNVGTGLNSNVNAICVPNDGSGDVYAVGLFNTYQGNVRNHIVRLNSDGSYDSAFDTTAGGFDDTVFGCTVANDGSNDLYVMGDFDNYNGTASSKLVRINSDGSYDSGFAVGSGFNSWAVASYLLTDGSGDLLVVGAFTSYQGVGFSRSVRLNSDGSIDSSFAPAGYTGGAQIVAVFGDDAGFLMGGNFTTYASNGNRGLVRVLSNGQRDDNYLANSQGVNGIVHTVAESRDGSVYVGGLFTRRGDTETGPILRLHTTGDIDTSFALSQTTGIVNDILPSSGGGLYAVGVFSSYGGVQSAGIFRAFENGLIDTGFAAGSGFGGAFVNKVVFSPAQDGDVYVVGLFTNYQSSTTNRIVRLNSDGSEDSDFDISLGGFDNWARTIITMTDGTGDIYVGGTFTNYNAASANYLVRINSDGSKDSAFDTYSSGFNADVTAIMPAPDGSGDLYVGGSFGTYKGVQTRRLVRLRTDGSLDTSFGPLITGNSVDSIVPAGDGSGDIIVGGQFTGVSGSSAYAGLARLNPDGSIDSALAAQGIGGTTVEHLLRTNTHLYAGGSFINTQSGTVEFLVRLGSAGNIE